jgi:hypothetical protein
MKSYNDIRRTVLIIGELDSSQHNSRAVSTIQEQSEAVSSSQQQSVFFQRAVSSQPFRTTDRPLIMTLTAENRCWIVFVATFCTYARYVRLWKRGEQFQIENWIGGRENVLKLLALSRYFLREGRGMQKEYNSTYWLYMQLRRLNADVIVR